VNGTNDKYSGTEVNPWEPEDAGSVYYNIREQERKEEEEKKKEKQKDDSGKNYLL